MDVSGQFEHGSGRRPTVTSPKKLPDKDGQRVGARPGKADQQEVGPTANETTHAHIDFPYLCVASDELVCCLLTMYARLLHAPLAEPAPQFDLSLPPLFFPSLALALAQCRTYIQSASPTSSPHHPPVRLLGKSYRIRILRQALTTTPRASPG